MLCRNSDSSLQVGGTWKRGPFANPLQNQHAPRSACEIRLQSLISHSRDRAVNSSEHVILIFLTVSLTFRYPLQAFSPPLKKLKRSVPLRSGLRFVFAYSSLYCLDFANNRDFILSLPPLHFFKSELNRSHILHPFFLLLPFSK